MENETFASWMLYGGLGFGVVFGFVLQRSRFCLLAGVSNFVLFRDWRHLHAWLVAIAVAMIGTAVLEITNLVPIGESSFRTAPTTWAGTVLGGFVFGLGTAFAGGCASRTLIRASEGNFGALRALIGFAAGAMATLFGVLEPLRGYLLSISELDLFSGEISVAGFTNIPQGLLAVCVFSVSVTIIIVTGRVNRQWGLMGAGGFIGALVVVSWWYTGNLAQDEFDIRAPFSLSVSGPLARTGLWLTTGTVSATWFGITLVLGMLGGGVLSALSSRTYHWVVPEATRVPHLIGGGLMMGIGAVFAGGCNIGHGIAGLSTLSISSILAVAAILAGMRLGIAMVQSAEDRKATTPPSTATNKSEPVAAEVSQHVGHFSLEPPRQLQSDQHP